MLLSTFAFAPYTQVRGPEDQVQSYGKTIGQTESRSSFGRKKHRSGERGRWGKSWIKAFRGLGCSQ